MKVQPPATPTADTTTTAAPVPTGPLHALADAQDLISQARVVDLLLDLYAVAATAAVRLEVEAALTFCRHRTLVRAAELRSCLALIDGAEEVESAFAHLLLAS
ncbi:MAG: hypothetical protein ACKV2O_04415 [Acidimicrobiales bacterium]